MGIFSRFADIVNSNISAILDKAEDPEKMVRLIIQEMEDTLVEVRSTSAKVLAEKKELLRRIARVQEQVQDWQNKAELALSKDREDLAKAALSEKQKTVGLLQTLEMELQVVEEHVARLKDEIAQLQEKLNDARARQKTIIMRKQTATSRLEVKKQLDSSKIDDAMMKFEQYERRVEGLEAQVESYDLGKKNVLADEFAALEAEDSVNDELAALKAKMSAKAQPKSKA
ncbi:phage shock protein PspA [Shewanella frigidimarina]|jgi:phage shock protein A|uniref:Phage shock protein A, PspA n=1 Tax=Shewanella frigidimarina (strain NCIMB 400) TaxID=318167 RepID=Q07ZZ6_SHEFN|nr:MULTISPECIES: phage shock protein PspA [Shewanella]MBB1382499.1 phage shock protein PspA [Shewanella sp. SR41-2]ABI72419.1 phage shock protein A, PspA [Shewanella frigidimarina NCIMB 400]MBB1361616.1 phage shock protein PspA [Shewanella sp. SR44-4]MBB1427802.1 phage shock protein PspA [Shewanella sp. SG44-2]PKH29301.1 phage shock protein PspA [Shewanella sp. ALD9]|tara:strand:- start:299 stop:982 length:684 start_codon:yes stop_codon:yes gene_type:complete